MKNKAYLRIIEAVLAVMIIGGAVLVIFANQPRQADISDNVYEIQTNILEVISNNESMRNEIIGEKTNLANIFIASNIPSSLDFTTNICEVEEICNQNTPNDRDVYVSETIISSNLTDYPEYNEGPPISPLPFSPGKSKKLRLFIWRK